MHVLTIYLSLRSVNVYRRDVTSDTDRPDLGAMAARLARLLITLEQPILAENDLSMWAYVVLTALRDEPMRTQAALAKAIGADKTRLIPVLDDLQRRGLIEREPDPADRRVRLLALTDAGRDVHTVVRAAIRAAERGLLEKLSTEDEQVFLRCLEHLSEGRGKPDAT
jgi:DNA-binding MarR family transcriptional regulator